jgi:hypothetical protein
LRSWVAYLSSWDPVSRFDTGQEQIARNLPDDIANGPAGLHVIELIAIQSQILFHARYEGIVDVDLIQIFDKIS